MKDEQMDDLKQYIAAQFSQSEQSLKLHVADAISQSEQRLTTNLTTSMTAKIDAAKTELKADIETVRTEMHDGFAAVAEPIDRLNDVAENHDKRLTKLESQIA